MHMSGCTWSDLQLAPAALHTRALALARPTQRAPRPLMQKLPTLPVLPKIPNIQLIQLPKAALH